MVNIPAAERFGRTEAVRQEADRRLTDLERTDGSQYGRLLEKVRALVSGLAEQVQGYITAYSRTRGEIDAKWASQDAAINSKEPAFGVLTPGKGGTGTGNVYSTTSTGTQLQVFVRPDGILTVGASSERWKQDIAPPQVDLAAVLQLAPKEFRWRSEVEAAREQYALDVLADDGGPADPVPEPVTVPLDYGLIAEEAEAAGCEWLVMRGPDGATEGVLYQRLPLALLHVARDHDDRVASLETQIQGLTALVAQQQAQIDMLTARPDGQEGGTP